MPSRWLRAAIMLPVEKERQPRTPSPRPISGPDAETAVDLVPEHQRDAGEPEQRAERDARPERLAEEQRGESDVGERGEREDDREQARHDVVAGIVEEDEVGRVEEEAERREAQVRAERKRDPRAGDAADQEHQRRGDQEAPDDRDLRVDHAELELQREPGRAPDEHRPGEEAEIASDEGRAPAQRLRWCRERLRDGRSRSWFGSLAVEARSR